MLLPVIKKNSDLDENQTIAEVGTFYPQKDNQFFTHLSNQYVN